MGDPIEIEAISRAFHHKSGRPTLVGAVKPALGHSEGASGISSIIKLVLALEKRLIPATIGLKNINPDMKTDQWNVDFVASHRQWPMSLLPRASVNSFGFGGANGHAVLEAASVNMPIENASNTPPNKSSSSDRTYFVDKPCLILLSAHTEYSLTKVVNDLSRYAAKLERSCDIRDLAYTLNCRRSRFKNRGYLVASQTTLVSDLDPSRLMTQQTNPPVKVPFAFVYTGQGAQWPGMGNQLIRQYPVFRESIAYLDACLCTLNDEIRPLWNLGDILLNPQENHDIHLAEKSQPLTTAVQIALTDMLHEWGVMPVVVFGHSSGEIAAAYAAGFLTARQAMITAFCRGFVVSQNGKAGAMVAVGLGKRKSEMLIDELALQDEACVACVNSPGSSTQGSISKKSLKCEWSRLY